MREIDRRAIEEYHIPGIVLMENAGIAAAGAAFLMARKTFGRSALILCGGGNNGGDGLVVARCLHNLKVAVTIALAIDPTKYTGDALINWRIVQSMKLPVTEAAPRQIGAFRDGMIVDAIFGTGLEQTPRAPFAEIAQAVNESRLAVLAIDLPSGLDCDHGSSLGPACIKATETVTFVAEKVGFANPLAKEYLGKVHVAGIGCPRELIEEVARS